ncbi:aminoglycoside phosphotransferase (APT) family kinase protein [Streptomyces griseochromogenes]|uniref:Aminoglycoside phosphotransferase n=1 Tax=Streptomyces griseochromogenes TaxID=68214 RepID=A0A1B1B044_9ACTN|nr:aminoglycoside phosphotransferase family protein [Streptomyces griseochromogenes]ANP52194.1 aminoglycoside phosphotransferase [Streptomyces griseochromogenes]MBP2056461.1 aminoglycoside phosphotransferase (APT) family kinase protein [Streptomyces griseochromogenes]
MDSFEIDENLVRSLVREQHPDLAGLELREVAGGWDNQLWRLGDEFAVRMPRTERAPSLLRKEHQWLPALAPRLPLPVPTPMRIGKPSARFPRPWTIATWVPGEPADRSPISHDGAADTLAGFLKALHVKAPADAPVSQDRGVPLKTLSDGFEKGLEEVASGSDVADLRNFRDVWDEAIAAPDWEGPPVWLHGDLHPANVVVSDGTLSGVIDFGDMCAGDPAVDLAAAWVLLPAGAASRFFDAYADADEAMIRRARGLAAAKSLFLILMGRAGERGLPGGKPTWGPAGRAALDRVLASI